MKLEEKRFKDVAILTFVGEFDTFNLPMFSERVDRMLEDGDKLFILDVRLLTFINSSALGYLIQLSRRVKEASGDVVMSRPSKFVRKTLTTLGLEAIFPIFESDEDAILYLRKGKDTGQIELVSSEPEKTLLGEVPVMFRHTEPGESGELPPNQVGRILNLMKDGLLFRYEAKTDDDPVEGYMKPGTKLKLKFRQPFAVKDHYFEMSADVSDVSTVEDLNEKAAGRVLTIMVAYDELNEGDRQLLDRFVEDQQHWSREAHRNG